MQYNISISLTALPTDDLTDVSKLQKEGKLSPLICELLHNHFVNARSPPPDNKIPFEIKSHDELAQLEADYRQKNTAERDYFIKAKFAVLKGRLEDKGFLRLAWDGDKLLMES